MRVTQYEDALNAGLVRAERHAPFLRNLAARRPELAPYLDASEPDCAEARRDGFAGKIVSDLRHIAAINAASPLTHV